MAALATTGRDEKLYSVDITKLFAVFSPKRTYLREHLFKLFGGNGLNV